MHGPRGVLSAVVLVAFVSFASGDSPRAQEPREAGGIRSEQSGREFSGFFELSDATDDTVDVRLTLAVRIFNYGTADAVAAEVVVLNPEPFGAPFGTAFQVDIPSQRSVLRTFGLIVPKPEYDSWIADGTPRVEVRYANLQGDRVHRLVQLLQLPVGSGEGK